MKRRPLAHGVMCGAALLFGCEFRKPLQRPQDAAPPVELVEARPTTLPASPSTPITVPLVDEHEPNDDREHAQPIEAGKGARGSLAPPTSLGAGKGDDDWYVYTVPAAGSGPQLVRIQLSGGAQADFSLEVLDPEGQRIALLDERGRGEMERMSGLALAPGQTVYLRVRGSVTPGSTAPADFAYQLALTQSAAPAGSEIEPNDTPALASRGAGAGADLTGTISHRKDEDFWVISLPEALGRKPRAAQDGEAGTATAGIESGVSLRVEVFSPGVTPALRVQIERAQPARPAEPASAPPPEPADGGAPPARPPLHLTTLLDVAANKSDQELRLRNIAIPAGTARVFLGLRAQTFNKSLAESRYRLRVTVEPELEGSEVEPNDDCAKATPIQLGGPRGTAEGEHAGFLWPGDIDCYRLRPPADAAATPLRWTLKLNLPGGNDCQAALEVVRSAGVQLGSEGTTATSASARGKGDLLVRVFSRERKTCFDAPYLLSARAEPDRPAAGAAP